MLISGTEEREEEIRSQIKTGREYNVSLYLDDTVRKFVFQLRVPDGFGRLTHLPKKLLSENRITQ